MITKISKGQQITIPSAFRSKLHLKVGSKVEIELQDKEIVITPLEEDLEKLFAEARKRKPKRHLSAAEMDAVIENEIHR